jgi:aspartyl-tRNA(Asn)/glutamyl-tRNA(Gln) amidotransferase subunit B
LKSNKLTGTLAKQVLQKMYKTGKDPEKISADSGLEVIGDDDQLKAIAQEVIMKNTKVVADLDKNPNAIRFLVGQVMRETKGKADPLKTETILKTLLKV